MSVPPESKEILPAWDPLGYARDLPLSADFYPLGFHVELQTDSKEVLAAAKESWDGFSRVFPDPPLQLRATVSEEDSEGVDVPPVARAHENLLAFVGNAGNFAICDFDKGLGCCWAQLSLVNRRAFFRYHYLEGMCYALLAHRSVTPVHASCVSRNGRGVLLCGKSGTGKSCLAYACGKAGLSFVGDGTVFVARNGAKPTILANSRFIKLRTSAVALFPELERRPTTLDARGKQVIELQTGQLHAFKTGPVSEAQHVVFLQRGINEKNEFIALGREEALQRLLEDLPLFSASTANSHVRSLQFLVERGAYLLRYNDLTAAVEQVNALLG